MELNYYYYYAESVPDKRVLLATKPLMQGVIQSKYLLVSNLKPDARLEVADSAGRAGMSLPAVVVVV